MVRTCWSPCWCRSGPYRTLSRRSYSGSSSGRSRGRLGSASRSKLLQRFDHELDGTFGLDADGLQFHRLFIVARVVAYDMNSEQLQQLGCRELEVDASESWVSCHAVPSIRLAISSAVASASGVRSSANTWV